MKDCYYFRENVNDASMCLCGMPDLYHPDDVEGRPDLLTRRPDLADLAAVGVVRSLALRSEA